MQVSTATLVAPRSAPSVSNTPEESAANIDFQNFLQLLTAQLRNQDPTSPLDATEFVSQLASFSSVEQLVSANRRLDDLAAALAGGDLEKYSGWIGLKAQVADGIVNYSGAPVQIRTVADPNAASAELVIADATGAIVERRPVANVDAIFTWDGRLQGSASTNGQYAFSVDYHDANGALVGSQRAIVSSVIQEIRLSAQGAEIGFIDGRRALITDIVGIGS